MGRLLIVVDMQNDFVTGSLKNEMAQKIIPDVKKKIEEVLTEEDSDVIFTMDTHYDDYLDTEEGKNLPVIHCIKNTEGWQLVDDLQEFNDNIFVKFFLKNTFGSVELGSFIKQFQKKFSRIDIIGICTDICVISNALLIKAFVPNIPIYVDASCCAGVSVESHDTALQAMKATHIHVDNEGKEAWRK